MSKTSIYSVLVQLEDVDALGVLYHSNYLNYMERARSQILRDSGKTFGDFVRAGIGLVVAECKLRFLKPARMDDKLWILTTLTEPGRSHLWLKQIIVNKDPVIVAPETCTIHDAEIRLVSIDIKTGKPCEMTAELKQGLGI